MISLDIRSSLQLTNKFIFIRHIDMLILNAGVFALPYTLSKDGLEATFQICHLSHFYLTLKLRPLLDYKSRVVVVSSESHRLI